MALKKSQLYSSIWQSCDALRGGMDASQYKDYVLVMLFVKYISDKYAGKPFAPIVIRDGINPFNEMVKLKNNMEIGDKINTKILGPLAEDNNLALMPDFNDPGKLGKGTEKRDRLTELVAIFENPDLDFTKNRAEGDDLLGDAYEYLMRHFATESGKSKGQFYTPAEVSRVMAAVLNIAEDPGVSRRTTVFDPTCGSGSLLLKVADAASDKVSLYGQEKDIATSDLARMNMILHDRATATIEQGNTLAHPSFFGEASLKTFDYVVANPPFSDKRWSTGVTTGEDDPHGRFAWGTPPEKQGDYAYLLHIIRSLKSTGRGACILPHGVLFRGGAEAEIRQKLITQGYIEGIIGLPANLFYGTGIPACIIVIDKENRKTRNGIFMMDASKGFIKDGNKNRLRERDIHRIVDVYNEQEVVPKYSDYVSYSKIKDNGYSLNIPRYIDSAEPEDEQDIGAHLQGGIPLADVADLQAYWQVCPELRQVLFAPLREDYLELTVDKNAVKDSIYRHPQFIHFTAEMERHFQVWRDRAVTELKGLCKDCLPKRVIKEQSEELLEHYYNKPLLDAYDIYQHLMGFWEQTMSDDCYQISADGWVARPERIIEKITKGKDKGKEKIKGWFCDLVPKSLMVARYFTYEQQDIDDKNGCLEELISKMTELEEEHGDEGYLGVLDKVNKVNVAAQLKQIKPRGAGDEREVLQGWQTLNTQVTDLKKVIRDAESVLDSQVYKKYGELTEGDVQQLVVDDKWLAQLSRDIHGEMDRITRALTRRIKELAARYETPMSQATAKVAELEEKVAGHLAKMGFSWT